MKTILILLSLSLGSFATADQSAEVQCTIENYQDFIDKPGLHVCNLQDADLRGADLFNADLRGADLQYAKLQGANLRFVRFRGAKVKPEQAKYLRAKRLSGFVIVVE